MFVGVKFSYYINFRLDAKFELIILN
jgi:hypothetical protein